MSSSEWDEKEVFIAPSDLDPEHLKRVSELLRVNLMLQADMDAWLLDKGLLPKIEYPVEETYSRYQTYTKMSVF